MSDLTVLARIEHLRGEAEARAATFFEPIPYDALIDFASDVIDGKDLTGWVINGTVEELLRAFSYATLLREIHRRAEVAELEDDGD